ncbi:DNA-binding Lrp family transcriptional regulator [Nocardiopsis terrae]|uniref:DNA-binding Lrp family transcriptional regulator n=1 Tax=Nocardiopsis terrae TaxID=372655 RepID=A0ABR9HNX1_9ACTN|nr:Lrp/AsnC family transcriptional regulator [Nocardiopsis terrae]MBE1460714.1 DNA-binding Lrp family transcriptional regulator [Nocardiopsis terrae]
MLDDVDQQLVHALQISPRADWSLIGDVLGIDAVTAARRWQRMSESGSAWVSVAPGTGLSGQGKGCLAFVEVDCVSGALLDVARAFTSLPYVVTVEHVTGDRDLLLTVMMEDVGTLSRWVVGYLDTMEGIRSSRTHVAGAVFTEGSRWRLRALDPKQVDRIAQDVPALEPAGEPDALDRRLMVALSVDGRASYTDLARTCGSSPDTVRRRVRRMFASRVVQARCEVSRPLSEWPVAVIVWAQLPPDGITAAAQRISSMREVRSCAGVTGRHNLMVAAWSRSVEDAQRFEAELVRTAPQLVVGDRSIALWPMKLSGHLLDQHGFRTGMVPVDPWEVDTGHGSRDATQP